jgi:hypothetical protein
MLSGANPLAYCRVADLGADPPAIRVKAGDQLATDRIDETRTGVRRQQVFGASIRKRSEQLRKRATCQPP